MASSQKSPDDFFEAAVAAFDFLRAYGFGAPTREHDFRNRDDVARVRFASSTVTVVITDDPNSEITCQLSRNGDPFTPIDLWHIRMFSGSDGELFKWGEAQTGPVLSAMAGELRKNGASLLRGDASAWKDIQRWWADGMPRRRHV